MTEATLVGEGPTDKLLLHPIRWLLRDIGATEVAVRWADLSVTPRRPRGLRERVTTAVDLYPCDILLVHRDADGPSADPRYDEIRAANSTGVQHVAVVPIRTQEAWLLISTPAIRAAAGCPRGRVSLEVPPPSRLERLAAPKDLLRAQLRAASERTGRKLKQFDEVTALYRLAELIEDWSPLRQLASFRRLEADLRLAGLS